jgi:microcystin degradation protein MlrC
VTAPRIGVASIVQETNTFSPTRTTIDDFAAHRIFRGRELRELVGVNTEAGGAIAAIERRGAVAVPLVKAWAMSGGPITAATLDELCRILRAEAEGAGPLDGVVLSLHGALVGEAADCGDLVLLRALRASVGEIPVGVCLDLHANVTAALVRESTFLLGYRTYPHVDMAETGARTANLLLDALDERVRPVTQLAKVALLTPPEGQGADGPFGQLRAEADGCALGAIVDVGLFPVQPWLDVPELGFGVTVTADGDTVAAADLANALVRRAWQLRDQFAVELVEPATALERARHATRRPLLLSESADSPTAGATGDSPAVVRALIEHGNGLRAYATLVDGPAVEQLTVAGPGTETEVELGCTLDRRFHQPVRVAGTVAAVGSGGYVLTGPVFTGMEVSMGRWARLDAGSLSIVVTERPACTFDPETYRRAGLPPEDADVVVVRSANLFRAGWGRLSDQAIVLDVAGASTPRFDSLDYRRIPRPMYPLDR